MQLLGAHSEKIVRGARKENGRRLHLRACIACVCASPHGEPCWRHVATPVRRRLPTWRPAGRDGGLAHVVRCAGKARQPPLCSLRLCWAGCVQASDARRAVMLCLLCCFLWVVCVRVGWMAVGLVCFFCFSCVFFAFLGSQWRIWAFGKKMSFLCYVGRSGRGL